MEISRQRDCSAAVAICHAVCRGAQTAPDFLDCFLAVHQADDGVGTPVEPVLTAGGGILHYIPVLAAIDMSVEADMTAQSRFDVRHPVPVCAVKGHLVLYSRKAVIKNKKTENSIEIKSLN